MRSAPATMNTLVKSLSLSKKAETTGPKIHAIFVIERNVPLIFPVFAFDENDSRKISKLKPVRAMTTKLSMKKAKARMAYSE